MKNEPREITEKRLFATRLTVSERLAKLEHKSNKLRVKLCNINSEVEKYRELDSMMLELLNKDYNNGG